MKIKVGEIRWFTWGDEAPGMVSTWTVREDRSVKLLGYMDRMEAIRAGLVFECPYN